MPVELQLLDQRARAPIEVLDPIQPRNEPKVLLDGQVLEQVRLVRHERQPALGGDRIGDDIVAVDRDAAGGRPQNAGERPQGGRLARAVGTDESDDLAGAGLEREIVDRRERRPAGSGIDAREVLDSKGHVLEWQILDDRFQISEVVIDVASHASALKAHRQSLKNRERNRQYRSRLRNALRDIRSAVDGNDMKAAKDALKQTISLIDKMTTKGVIHRNAAGRYKSRLSSRLSSRSA